MKSFKEYLSEENNGSLHVFDVDETLFKTHAKIHVKHGNRTVQTLSNSEYNNHTLKHGHHYDYSEFRSADEFHDNSHPIHKMIRKLRAIHKNIKDNDAHKMIINTARTDMDDKDKYLSKFRKHGIPIDDIHVHRAGNIPGNQPVPEKKTEVIRRELQKKKYKKVHMYDDSPANLDTFLALKKEHPDTEFHAWHVQPDGSVKRYHGE